MGFRDRINAIMEQLLPLDIQNLVYFLTIIIRDNQGKLD